MLEVVLFYCLSAVFLFVSWVDFKERIVPNGAVVALIALRVGLLIGSLLDVGEVRANIWGTSAFLTSVIIACSLCACMAFVAECISKHTGSMALGFGDVKLIFACVLFCTLEEALLALLITSVFALVLALVFFVYKKDRTFPFAPALCVGFGAVLTAKIF